MQNDGDPLSVRTAVIKEGRANGKLVNMFRMCSGEKSHSSGILKKKKSTSKRERSYKVKIRSVSIGEDGFLTRGGADTTEV